MSAEAKIMKAPFETTTMELTSSPPSTRKRSHTELSMSPTAASPCVPAVVPAEDSDTLELRKKRVSNISNEQKQGHNQNKQHDDYSFYDSDGDSSCTFSSDDESCTEEETMMVKKLVSSTLVNRYSASALVKMFSQPEPTCRNKSGGEGDQAGILPRVSSSPAATSALEKAVGSQSLTTTTTAAPVAHAPATAALAAACQANATQAVFRPTYPSNRVLPPMMSVAQVTQMRQRLMSESAPCLVIRQRQAQAAAAAAGRSSRGAATAENPDRYLRKLLERHGMSSKTIPATKLENFFLPNDLSQESIGSYDMTLVQAIRTEDLDSLRRLKDEKGRVMQCCNKFGESIVHTTCRRGSVQVLKFLLDEAKLTVRLCCDSGRTPLHDACWSSEPRFGIVKVLLERSPDLLHITDKRGFTPLAYVPRDHWQVWCRFLETQNIASLAAKEIQSLVE